MQYIEHNGLTFAVADRTEPIRTPQDALDRMVTAQYDRGCDTLIVYRESLPEAFFDLKTGLAGEILQKFSNYRMRLAIVGDCDGYPGGALRAFIRECNRGDRVFWADSLEDALRKFAPKT